MAGWWQGGVKAEGLRGIYRQVGLVMNGSNVWDEEKGNPRGSGKMVSISEEEVVSSGGVGKALEVALDYIVLVMECHYQGKGR